MTFIGIQCTSETAEIAVDSGAYRDRGTRFVETSKVDTFPHLDAAFACSGHAEFSHWAHRYAHDASKLEPTFDDWVSAAPEWLEAALHSSGEDPNDPSGSQLSADAFLVGYSPRDGGYVAYSASMQDLVPQKIEGLHVQPTPFSRCPGQKECDGLRAYMDHDDVPAEELDRLFDQWNTQPRPFVTDAADWIALAEEARTLRSLRGDFMRVFVTGSLYITRMRRGSIRTNRLHTFNDTGQELLQLLADTRHPLAQISPCHCDSGQPALDCCLKEELDDPCDCYSGKTFGDCCVVTDRDAVTGQLWT